LVLHLELWKLIRMNCLMMLHGVGVGMIKWGIYFISWIKNFHDRKHLDFYVFVLNRMHCKIDICTLSFKLSVKRNFVICYVVIPFESLTWIIEKGV
jgi:hypothetical protein